MSIWYDDGVMRTTPFANSSELFSHDADVIRELEYQLPADRTGLCGTELELDWRWRGPAIRGAESAFTDLPCFIAKRDSSIQGMELVSLPMTMEEHQTYIEALEEHGVLANMQATNRDGMHVHVDRGGLSQDALDRLMILAISPPMQDLLDVLSRRRCNNYCERRAFCYHDMPVESIIQRGKYLAGNGGQRKYCAINMARADTIEFRMFKATTSTIAYRRSLEVVWLMIDYARQTLSYEDFILLCIPAKFLAYLNERKAQYPLSAKWVASSQKFRQWLPGRQRATRDWRQTRLMGQTLTPTHDEVLTVASTSSRDEYCAWYADYCQGQFVSMRGHRRAGHQLRWEALYHLRLAKRLEAKHAPIVVPAEDTAIGHNEPYQPNTFETRLGTAFRSFVDTQRSSNSATNEVELVR